MLELSAVDFTAAVEPIGPRRLQELSERLFEAWDGDVMAVLPLDDFAIYLELEEGSLKGKGRVKALATNVIVALGLLDGATGGLQKLAHGGRAAASFLATEVHSFVESEGGKTVRIRRSAGDIGQIDLLFRKVRDHRLEPAEAEEELIRLLSKQPDIAPAMAAQIRHALVHTPRHPKQLIFDLPDSADTDDDGDTDGPPQRQRRLPPTPSEPAPAPALYRVEVWRDSKKGKRNVTIHPI